MIDYVTSIEFMSMLGLFVYWVPMAICLTVYFFRVIHIYKKDLENCESKYYTPELTIGLIVWWFLSSVVPVINLFALVFDCASSVFKWLGEALNIPLVRSKYRGADND